MTALFTIAIDRRFVDELAAERAKQYGSDPLALADVLILLPTRRSVRALALRPFCATDGRPTILPRMAPLGDVDESEWEVASGDGSALSLPPAIEPAERDALLARLVAAFTDRDQPIAQSAAQSLLLARELAARRARHRRRPRSKRLEDLVDGNFASHLGADAEVPSHRRRGLARAAGGARPDRRHRSPDAGDPGPGGTLARRAAGDAACNRCRLDRF